MDGVEVVEDDGGFIENFLLDGDAVVGSGSGVAVSILSRGGDGQGRHEAARVEGEEVWFFAVGVYFCVLVRDGGVGEEDPDTLDLWRMVVLVGRWEGQGFWSGLVKRLGGGRLTKGQNQEP